MKRRGNMTARLSLFTIGLLIMSLGIVWLILADLGATPWDVLHVGLFYQFGLTIGSWSIIVGFFVLGISAVLMKERPKFGAFLNMLLLGIFMDFYLMLPFMVTPNSLFGKIVMFVLGMLIYSYGMGIYISAQLGAGPRDSFMLAIMERTGWKVSHVRRGMEVIVLIIGWSLGGPVHVGTIIFSILIGTIVGFSLPQCQRFTNKLIDYFLKNKQSKEIKRGVSG
ncbi:YczE/YyaS/YitT family protein [Bacillus chungangensis]|uniref:Membrane protein YczE n=1 Tax=Bacillus chungangensis TaxID=587633 RepID=A0ABT9WLY2_9BACI|nr:YitT family protein [Bacillus chungangensis]MDQ0174266.1 putative membrane protein YczE [Bacillus chungangensis]